LLVGQTVSALGDWMATFAVIALVYQQSGSSTAVGGILALRLIPAALGGPLAARAASRWPPTHDHDRDGPLAGRHDRAGSVRARPVVDLPLGFHGRGGQPRVPARA